MNSKAILLLPQSVLVIACLAVLSACASMPRSSGSSDDISHTSPQQFVVIAVDNPPQVVASRAGSTLRGYDAVIPYGATASARIKLTAIARDYRMTEVAAWPIAALQLHCVLFRVPTDAERAALLDRLSHDKRIKLAQPLQSFDSLAMSYNDPYFSLQKGFEAMDVADAHRWSRGDGIRVAIVDTGVDIKHPDLKGRVAEVRNFVDKDMQRFVQDKHGTQVAGVIAANPNNREGIVGIAPGARLIALKACWQLRSDNADARCNSFTLAQALAAAIDLRAQIVNLSISGPNDPLLDALIVRGIQQGIVFVGAVAPDGSNNRFPISTRGVVPVDAAEHRSSFRDALPAPGANVVTLAPAGRYDFASGPSLATAHVTGLAALLLNQNRHFGTVAIDALLRRSLTIDDGAGARREMVNACNAMAALKRSERCRSVNAAIQDVTSKNDRHE